MNHSKLHDGIVDEKALHPVEHMEPEVDLNHHKDELAEVLRVFFLWILDARSAKGIAARFSVLCSSLGIGEMDTLSDISKDCECSLAYCSQIADEIDREFGVKHPSKQRSADA